MKDALTETPTVLVIPQPASRRNIAIAMIAFCLVILAIGPWKLGSERFFESFAHLSATWLIILMLAPIIALFARLAFPPRNSLPRLEISRTGIRVVPGWIARSFAETPVEIGLTSQSNEILLCYCLSQGTADGLRMVVRVAGGAEREIRASSLDYLSARAARELAGGISATTGLPVRLLIRNRLADGSIREDSWTPPSRRLKMAKSTALAMGGVPLVGGAVLGLLWPTPAMIVVNGLGLWLFQMGVISLVGRHSGSRVKLQLPYLLTTIFSFAATYGLAVVVVGFIFRSR